MKEEKNELSKFFFSFMTNKIGWCGPAIVAASQRQATALVAVARSPTA